MSIKVYAAGPSVFLADHKDYELRLRAAAASVSSNIELLYPLDNVLDLEDKTPQEVATAIARGNIELIQRADAVIADIRPWRGSGMDSGTAFEIGMAIQRGIPVVTYTDQPIEDYFNRVKKEAKHLSSIDGDTHDHWGLIENFGYKENLMISAMCDYTNKGIKDALKRVLA